MAWATNPGGADGLLPSVGRYSGVRHRLRLSLRDSSSRAFSL